MATARRSYNTISADSHTVEPPDLWEKWLEKKYLDTAPKLVDDGDGGDDCNGSGKRSDKSQE